MPQQKHNVVPLLQVGDTVVQVGPLNWAGVTALAAAFDKAQLALPDLQVDGIRQKIAELKGNATVQSLVGLAYECVAANLSTFYQWVLKHPPLVQALVANASNLSPEQAEQLTAGETMRVARAAWQATVDDGFFSEAAGFFGGLLGLRSQAANATEEPSGVPESAAVSVAA